ncbi:GAF and ANTAR domain-containing protein [Rhodococcus sp. CX]|uniref:GAF and ANTAR domain-containing protein n=1 Tax=Rhodococcus sp. CX TaxID=2789880 RepID=UPI0018CF12C7|nr:GAF and ANTAR domain-containing protein [Rhodococcus sp. CX]MBH0122245.1 GAF and ANTAR domain-containing protein [Rhodococcus sp. CX]
MSNEDAQREETGAVFARLAEIVYGPEDYAQMCAALCVAAPMLVPGCDRASLVVRRGSSMRTVAAGDDTARRIDAAERELGEGPCIDVLHHDTTELDTDLAVRTRWPALTKWILESTPVRGAAGFRLTVEGADAAALNIFSDTPGALTEQSLDAGAVLAAFASVALSARAHRDQAVSLRAGLESNREIGKAIGLLMAIHEVPEEQAFTLLREASQRMNLRLSEVAKQVVETLKRTSDASES